MALGHELCGLLLGVEMAAQQLQQVTNTLSVVVRLLSCSTVAKKPAPTVWAVARPYGNAGRLFFSASSLVVAVVDGFTIDLIKPVVSCTTKWYRHRGTNPTCK